MKDEEAEVTDFASRSAPLLFKAVLVLGLSAELVHSMYAELRLVLVMAEGKAAMRFPSSCISSLMSCFPSTCSRKASDLGFKIQLFVLSCIVKSS